MIAISLVLSCVGLWLVAVAMLKHYRQVWGGTPRQPVPTILRVAGVLVILAGASANVRAFGFAMGLVSWILCYLPACGVAVVAGLAYWPTFRARRSD